MNRASADIQIIDYRDLAESIWQPKSLSNTHNAMGFTPMPILYLWIFERPDSLCGQLITHGWAFLGPIYLLVSPSARVDGAIMKSTQDIDRASAEFQTQAGNYKCPKLIDYEYRANYHGYPINYLWCTDKTWEYGFESMASRCEYFIMDLTAEERPEGLLTEVTYLFHYVPLEKVIFLVDTYRADLDLVQDFLLSAWSSMSPDAVNSHLQDLPPLISYNSSHPAYLMQAQLSLWSGKSKVPLARKAAHFAQWGS